MLSLKPGPFVQSYFDMHAAQQPHEVTQLLSASLYFFFFGSVAFSEHFCAIPLSFSLCMESTSYVFSPFWMVFFYLVTTDCFFTPTYVIIQSINQ